MTDDLAHRRMQVARDREELGATLRVLSARFDVPARAEAKLRATARGVRRHALAGPYLVPAVLTLAAVAVVYLTRRHR